MFPLLADLSDALINNAGWIAAGVIVLLGLLIYGLKDVTRLTLRGGIKRAWAVSSVGFDESIRKKVLWITPLAIVGVIAVSQFTKPIDEQDAIRQTTKYCLFATGLVVTLTAIILAGTSLPKEIENRVIFTIVTKPTTRLEIVLGKVMGFARVSAAILVIMGLFSFGYLALRAWRMQVAIRDRLADASQLDPGTRRSLEHYRDQGLLGAKRYFEPADLQFYAAAPRPDAPDSRWASMSAEQSICVPFDVDPLNFPSDAESAKTALPLVIHLFDIRARPTHSAVSPAAEENAASQPAVRIPFLPGHETINGPAGQPAVTVDLFDQNFNTLFSSALAPVVNAEDATRNHGQPIRLQADLTPIAMSDGTVRPAYQLIVQPKDLAPIGKWRTAVQGSMRVYLHVSGAAIGYDYGVPAGSARMMLMGSDGKGIELARATDPSNAGQLLAPLYRGRWGTVSQQIPGRLPIETAPVAVVRYHNVTVPSSGVVPLEFRTVMERSDDAGGDTDTPTRVQVRVTNAAAGLSSAPIDLYPDNGRTAYANIPATALTGGNFSVEFRSDTIGAWVGLAPGDVGLVSEDGSFFVNLFKSLLILWLLSVLVIAIAVFCSTFLSWPIAVVLTVVILLGHWGVNQLGDATQPGIGNQVSTDFGIRDAADARVVSSSVEALSKMLRAVSAVLPDIERFSATEDIEKGMVMPAGRLWSALGVIGAFGVPLTVLAYVFLRNKEVAP